MNVLLIYPKYPDTFWSFKHVLWFIKKKAAFAPLGLLTVAAMLPKEWKLKLIDLNICELEDSQIRWADMVFISAMIVQSSSAQQVISKCKAKCKTVVAGGPAFTAQPEKFYGVDYYILNEAEITLPLFLADLALEQAKPIYKSVEKPKLSRTPIPRWDLIDFKNYATAAVQYSRACPNDCEFCDITSMFGRIPRMKSPEQFIGEIQSLYDSNWRGSVFIVDDNFIGNKKHVKIMLAQLIKWQEKYDFPFKFFTEASVNLADDDELMDLMRKANFYKVFLGIETPCDASLKECHKFQNANRDLSKSIITIQQHGMQVLAGYIVGFDKDPENISGIMIDFIQKTGVVTAMVGILNALPMTKLWRRLKEEGRLRGDSKGENTDISLNFNPIMEKDKLIANYKEIISALYLSRKNYYRRIETFIEIYRSTVKSKLSKAEIRAFWISTWRIGIFSKSNYLYWKLIIKTLLVNTKALPTAIELAITGLHFRKVARRIIKT